MTYLVLGTIVNFVIGYLIGSFSPAISIGKWFYNTDVRDYYSHNAGATNTARVLGNKIGFLVFLIDLAKIMIAVLIAWGITYIPNVNNSYEGPIFQNASIYIAGLGGIIGHCLPLYYHFKGGKGVAATFGILLIINPYYFLIAMASFIIIVMTIRYVSVGSIFSITLIFGLSWIKPLQFFYLHPAEITAGTPWPWWWINLLLLIIMLIIIIAHQNNIKRLIKNQENKVSFHSNKN